MSRVHYGVARHRKHKRVLKRARGFWGGRHRLYRTAKAAIARSEADATTHRRLKKRDFRRLWIVRISAACRARDINYSRFMSGLKKASVALDRKSLSELAIRSPESFDRLVEMARTALTAA